MDLNIKVNDILLWDDIAGTEIWKYELEDDFLFKFPVDNYSDLGLSSEAIAKLDKLYKFNIIAYDDAYPPDSGFHTIEEVKYRLYYKLYVATLLSQEYTQGKVLLYGDAKDPISIEEYIVYLSKLTDEDLKLWLRADLQGDTSK